MGASKDLERLVMHAAEDLPFYTPRQVTPAGTAISENPPKLFEPIRIRGLQLQNRIMVSPLCQYSSEDGNATPWHLQHLGSFAMHGAGLTWTEATAITELGRSGPYDTGIYQESNVAAWRAVTNFVHSQNQKIGIQMYHAGRKCSTAPPPLSKGEILPEEVGGFPDQVEGPSAIPYKEGFPLPKEMSVERVHEMVGEFAAAAERAVRAGFDTVEIHAAHGYLINNFLSPATNQRTDRYGRSFENRTRFLVEITDAVRAVIPKDMPIFLRISATDWLDKSRPDIESWTSKDSVELAKLLIGKVDVIDVSTGGNHPDQKISFDKWSETPAGAAYQAPYAIEIKKAVGHMMLVESVGNISNATMANELLQEQGLDFVAIGRPWFKNPGLVNQFADELGVDVSMAVQHGYPFRGRGFAGKKNAADIW